MDTDGGRNILQGDPLPSLLTSLCYNVGYWKQIQEYTRVKTVPVSLVSSMCSKNSGQKRVWTQMEDEIYYGKIFNHHYLTQYVTLVIIENRFRNVQGLKQYQFSLFQLRVQKIVEGKLFGYGLGKIYIMGRSPTIITYINM